MVRVGSLEYNSNVHDPSAFLIYSLTSSNRMMWRASRHSSSLNRFQFLALSGRLQPLGGGPRHGRVQVAHAAVLGEVCLRTQLRP
jgi:hypothetical protein